MKKIITKIWNDNSGTALLTAMLIMGVLIAISIALSGLVIREVKVTKDLMDAGRAFYAAESGVEEALYFLNNKLPGWEPPEDGQSRDLGENGSNFKYSIKNTCNSYPCIDEEEYDISKVTDMSAFYDVMDLNESVLIPLFIVEKDENGQEAVKSVKDFTVEFYGNFDPSSDMKVQNVTGWDILRWKVFGMKNLGGDGGYQTESISDFTAFASGAGGFSNSEKPSWFGTVKCNDYDASETDGADGEGAAGDVTSGDEAVKNRITDKIVCNDYVVKSYGDSQGKSECSAGLQARDYYGDELTFGKIENQGCWDISKFVYDRQAGEAGGATGLNYLSLTNIVNPAMFKDLYGQDLKKEKSKIYFRVETYGDKTVREIAEIVVDGFSGDSKQSIKVLKKRDSYMPVFNFSIYSTYGSEEGYYIENVPKQELSG
jgi:hypothetical protein